MKGFSPRNLKYVRAFGAAWPDRAIVQRVIAQLTSRQDIALIERLDDKKTRLWYAEQTIREQKSWRLRVSLAVAGQLLTDIRRMIKEVRSGVAKAVNAGLTMLYWLIGKRTGGEILKERRAVYGKQIVATLSR